MSELMDKIRSRCIEDGPHLIWRGFMDSNGNPAMRITGERNIKTVRSLVMKEVGKWKPKMIATCNCGVHGCVAEGCLQMMTRRALSLRAVKETGYHLNPVRNAKIAAACRAARGKLTDEAIQQIRESDLPQHAIAAQLGVSQTCVGGVLVGRTYKTYGNPFSGLGAR